LPWKYPIPLILPEMRMVWARIGAVKLVESVRENSAVDRDKAARAVGRRGLLHSRRSVDPKSDLDFA
jgi:hypothetical protein